MPKRKNGKTKHVYDPKIHEMLHSDDAEIRQLGLNLLGFTGDNYQECLHLFDKYSVKVRRTLETYTSKETDKWEVFRKLPDDSSFWSNYIPQRIVDEEDYKYRKRFHSR